MQVLTLVPVFNWSSPDEQERQAQVRNWRRLLEIASELECPMVNSEFSGDPNDPVGASTPSTSRWRSSARSSSGTGSG